MSQSKDNRPDRIAFKNGIDIRLRYNRAAFLGLGDVHCEGVRLRDGRRPMFAEIATPYGEELTDYELTDSQVSPNRAVLSFGAKVRTGSLMEWQLHECRRLRTTADWSQPPKQVANVSLQLVLRPVVRRVGGLRFTGFSYQYRYRARGLPIYMLLDRGTWEMDGRTTGSEFWFRSCFAPSIARFTDRAQYYSTEWYLPSCRNPNVFQFLPLQTEGQGFTYSVAPSGILVTWPTRVAHVRALYEKPGGEESMVHLLEHCGDLSERFETAPVEVLFAAGAQEPTQSQNLYCSWSDLVADTLHAQAGLRRERVSTYGQIEEWGDSDLARYRTLGLPKLLAAGAKTVGLASHFQNNMNVYGLSNMCCTVDYKVAETVGEDKLRAFCRAAHDGGAKVEMWANTSISTITVQQATRNGRPKCIDFLPKEDSIAEVFATAVEPFVRTTFGSIEADHYTPQFAVLNLRDPAIRAYWMKRWGYANREIGLEGIFLDSSFNLSSDKFHYCYNDDTDGHGATADQTDRLGTCRSPRRPPSRILTQYHAHLELMKEMQDAGYQYCNEDTGVFGIHRHGPALTARLDSLFMWADHICDFAPAELVAKGHDPDDVFFRGLAHRMMWVVRWDIQTDCLTFRYGGPGGEEDRPNAWHLALYHAFNEVEPHMHQPTCLPDGAGVLYTNGKQRVLWSFRAGRYAFKAPCKVRNVLTGESARTDLVALQPHQIYVWSVAER